jgi:hypothetical protein
VLPEAELEHTAKGIDHVLARFLAALALTVSARNLGDRGDDPAVLPLLIDDRQLE